MAALNSYSDSWELSPLFMIFNEFQTMREQSLNINRAAHSKSIYFLSQRNWNLNWDAWTYWAMSCLVYKNIVTILKSMQFVQVISLLSLLGLACRFIVIGIAHTDAFRCDCHLSNWLSERKMLVMFDCDRALPSAFAADKLCTANC